MQVAGLALRLQSLVVAHPELALDPSHFAVRNPQGVECRRPHGDRAFEYLALDEVDIASPVHPGRHRHLEFCGVMFALKRETWDRFGPLDEEAFKVRKGDQDFAIRARMGGATLGLVPESRFEHVAPKHTKAKHGQQVIDAETAASRSWMVPV